MYPGRDQGTPKMQIKWGSGSETLLRIWNPALKWTLGKNCRPGGGAGLDSRGGGLDSPVDMDLDSPFSPGSASDLSDLFEPPSGTPPRSSLPPLSKVNYRYLPKYCFFLWMYEWAGACVRACMSVCMRVCVHPPVRASALACVIPCCACVRECVPASRAHWCMGWWPGVKVLYLVGCAGAWAEGQAVELVGESCTGTYFKAYTNRQWCGSGSVRIGNFYLSGSRSGSETSW